MRRMMRTLVVYYSLSGTTRTLAEALAAELGAEIDEIRCTRYRSGFWGFIRAAYDSLANRLPPIEAPQRAPDAYDLVLVGAPMWAGRAATPARGYLRREAGAIRNVAFFLTLGGAPAERALREMEALAGRKPLATLAVRDKDVTAGAFGAALTAFAAALKLPEAT